MAGIRFPAGTGIFLFAANGHTESGTHQASCLVVSETFSLGEWSEYEADQSLPFSAEI
jgi:hypothetical protein